MHCEASDTRLPMLVCRLKATQLRLNTLTHANGLWDYLMHHSTTNCHLLGDNVATFFARVYLINNVALLNSITYMHQSGVGISSEMKSYAS